MSAPPVLDVAPLLRSGAQAAPRALLRDLDAACSDWGLFQIVGHGLPRERLEAFDRSMREFFAHPLSVKNGVRRSVRNARGYYDRELTKNTRDWKEIFDFGHTPRPDLPDDHPENHCLDGWNQWPDRPADFEAIAKRQYADCERIAEALIGAVCLSLGVPSDALRGAFAPHSSFLRLNHYPVCDDAALRDAPVSAALHLGVNRHTAAGALTILYQDDVASLQVQHGDSWLLVEPARGALVVNLGDMFPVVERSLPGTPASGAGAIDPRSSERALLLQPVLRQPGRAPWPAPSGRRGPPPTDPSPGPNFALDGRLAITRIGAKRYRSRSIACSDDRSSPRLTTPAGITEPPAAGDGGLAGFRPRPLG